MTLFLSFNYSLGLYQWSDKVVQKVERLWDVRDNKIVPHTVYLLVTPRVVVSITNLLMSHEPLAHFLHNGPFFTHHYCLKAYD